MIRRINRRYIFMAFLCVQFGLQSCGHKQNEVRPEFRIEIRGDKLSATSMTGVKLINLTQLNLTFESGKSQRSLSCEENVNEIMSITRGINEQDGSFEFIIEARTIGVLSVSNSKAISLNGERVDDASIDLNVGRHVLVVN